MHVRFALACAALAAAAQASPVGPDLLVNGSFETGPAGSYAELPGGSGALAGWTPTLSGVEYFQPTAFTVSLAEDGLYAVDLANYVYTGGGISQTFATTAGQAYSVDFWGGTQAVSGRDGTGVIDVFVNGSLAGSFALAGPTAAIDWREFGLDFTATGAATTLEFRNTQDPYLHFAYLDDVTVGAAAPAGEPAVPEPSAAWLLPIGLLLLAAVRRPKA